MAIPTIRSVGTVASATGVATPGWPAGVVAGDLVIMFIETANQTVSVSGWTECPSSPQGTGTTTLGTRLTAYYRTYSVVGDNRATSDSGNHQLAQIIAITAGTWNTSNPFNTSAGAVDSSATTSVSIGGVTTTVDDCLLLYGVSGSLPDANGTAEFTSWSNGSLSSVNEEIDNTRTSGNGGSLGVASGGLASLGASGAMTVTAATSAVRGKICLAIEPAAAASASGAGWYGSGMGW